MLAEKTKYAGVEPQESGGQAASSGPSNGDGTEELVCCHSSPDTVHLHQGSWGGEESHHLRRTVKRLHSHGPLLRHQVTGTNK